MNNYEKIYWLTRLDNMNDLFVTMTAIGIVLFIGWHIFFAMQFDFLDAEEIIKRKKSNKWYKRISIIFMVVGSITTTFLPSKNDMILIYAGGKTMNYVQSDTSLSKIPYQTTAIISDYLDKSLKELREEKTDNKK